MGKIIRRTVTITIAETWTIVWTDDVQANDEPQPLAPTIVQEQVKPQEEPDEAQQTTIKAVKPGDSSASDPTVTPPTSAAAPDAQPNDVTTKPGAGSQRKRARGRRAKGEQARK